MASKTVIERRLSFRKLAIEELYKAYEALISGRVKSYMIDDRQLTYQSIPDLAEEIRTMEREIDELEAQLMGAKHMRSVGVLPMDW